MIPDAVINAAMNNLFRGGDGPVLAEASKRLMAQAWDEGARFVDEHIEVPYGGEYTNPYRPTHNPA